MSSDIRARSRQQISTSGGRRPLWSREGRELFSSASTAGSCSPSRWSPDDVGGVQVLFDIATLAPTAGIRPYDIAPDGRFIVIRPADEEVGAAWRQVSSWQNWTEELKRLVPAK